MKKIVRKATVLAMCLSILTCINYTEASDNNISFEEYSKTITNAYAEYGIEIEPIHPSDETVFTVNMLKEDLLKVPEVASKINASSQEKIIVEIKANFNNYLRAAYGKATGSTTVRVSGGEVLAPRWAKIKVKASVYANLNSCSIINAYAPSLSITSATGYADYIKRISYSASIDNRSSSLTKHNVKYTITCELKEETSIGVVNSWAKVKKTIVAVIKPFK